VTMAQKHATLKKLSKSFLKAVRLTKQVLHTHIQLTICGKLIFRKLICEKLIWGKLNSWT
jgi:hypothetical protein